MSIADLMLYSGLGSCQFMIIIVTCFALLISSLMWSGRLS